MNDICDPKWHLKCPRNFRPPRWILPKIFRFYAVLTYTFVIPSSKQKHTTGSLTHTHTHTYSINSNNYKQKTTENVISLANGSDAPYVCEIPTASNNFKKEEDNFADIGLAVGTPAGFDPTKACFKRLCWFGKRHKTDAFTKLGEPTIRAPCIPHSA